MAAEREQRIAWRHGAPLPSRYPRTLPALVADCVARLGDETVLVDNGTSCSWRDLESWSARLAAVWEPWLEPGDRVVLLLGNGLAHLLAELAAWTLGAVAVPVHPGQATERLRPLLAALNPTMAVVEDAALARALPSSCTTLAAAATVEWARAAGARCAPRIVSPRDPALVQLTSGSCGTPRPVLLCHENLCSQQAAFAAIWPEVGPGDRLAAYLPWNHSFGGLAERLWALTRGARLHVVPGGGRDRALFAATLREVRPTIFMSVPRMHRFCRESGCLDRAALRWAFTAGAAIADDEAAWYAEAGVPLYEGWGLTETSPSATITPPGEPRVAGVVGRPIPGVSVGVREGDGRIFVRGPGVMLGYVGDEEATARVLHDGALDSGDVGEWTDAGLRLLGRADRVLKLDNGEKLCAEELERRLEAESGAEHAVVLNEDGGLVAILTAPGADAGALAREVAAINRREPLSYRRLAASYLLAVPMSVANGMLTGTDKVSRAGVLARFRSWRAEPADEAFRRLT